MKVFDLEIITPAGVVFDDRVEQLSARTPLGAFGILANHAPFMATLAAGKLTARKADHRTLTFDVGPGVIDVRKNRATVLVDQCAELDSAP